MPMFLRSLYVGTMTLYLVIVFSDGDRRRASALRTMGVDKIDTLCRVTHRAAGPLGLTVCAQRHFQARDVRLPRLSRGPRSRIRELHPVRWSPGLRRDPSEVRPRASSRLSRRLARARMLLEIQIIV